MRLSRLRLAFVFVLLLAAVGGAAPAGASSNGVVISEFRFRGPVGGNDEFVELVNAGSAAVNISGWRLQGCSSTTGAASQRATVPAGVTLEPGQHYLFTNNNASGGYSGSVPGDTTYGTGFSDGSGARITLADQTTVIDGVGGDGVAGTQCREGTGISGMPTTNGDQSYERIGGTQDTDNNAADFAGPKAGNPQKYGPTGGDSAPTVASSTPADDANDVPAASNVTVVFSEPVATSAAAFAITCTATGSHTFAFSGSGTTYTLDPDTDFGVGERCTVTIDDAGVTDTDVDDPPNAMAADASFDFATLAPTFRIHEIQGAAHLSPHAGEQVSFVPGVVTAVRNNGFWMQDASPDGSDATSEGIFVFTSSAPTVAAGTAVTVSGLVTEFRPGGAGTDNLTTTELERVTVYPGGPGAITPTVVGTGGRIPPATVIDNDSSGSVESSGVFDPAQDGIDFYESLEGMLLQVRNAQVVGPTNGFGEVWVVGDQSAHAGPDTIRGGVVITPTDFNPERIQLDDVLAATPDANVGDDIPGNTTGVLSYDFGNFELLPLTAVAVVSGGIQRETTSTPAENELAVATFNVENLDPSDAPTIPRLARIVVENMRSPDLIGIEEMQDNTGATNDGTTAANLSWQAFIDAIVAVGGPRYDYRQIDPENNADGGQPGGNIRVGFLFRTDRGLRFVDRPGGDATTPTGVFRQDGHAHLTLSPGRVDPTNPAWVATRKPLAGEFVWDDKPFIAIVNHFSSKGGDDPLFGRWQPPIRSTEVARHQQAASVNAFVDEILAAERKANVIVLGDINDFEFSETTRILEGGVLTSLMHTLPQAERYSYVFEGNSQVLDQILFSDNMMRGLAEYDVVHVNAEFFDQASDHDPQVARVKVLGGGGGGR